MRVVTVRIAYFVCQIVNCVIRKVTFSQVAVLSCVDICQQVCHKQKHFEEFPKFSIGKEVMKLKCSNTMHSSCCALSFAECFMYAPGGIYTEYGKLVDSHHVAA